MSRARPATPLWVKAILVIVGVGVPGWLALQHHDRVANERRLAAVASAIAGRPVQASCPGVLGRVLDYDIVEGSVRFDADGRPGDVAELRATACAELDALAEGRRATVLACVAGAGACGRAADDLALAVDVLAHEAQHLAGIVDEGVAECRSLQTLAATAQRLGATAEQGRALAGHELRANYPRMPARYRAAGCVDGGPLDLRPADAAWP